MVIGWNGGYVFAASCVGLVAGGKAAVRRVKGWKGGKVRAGSLVGGDVTGWDGGDVFIVPKVCMVMGRKGGYVTTAGVTVTAGVNVTAWGVPWASVAGREGVGVTGGGAVVPEAPMAMSEQP